MALAVIFIITVLYCKDGLLGYVENYARKWLHHKEKQYTRNHIAQPAPHYKQEKNKGDLKIENIDLQIGEVRILENLTLSFNDKKNIYCLIGPNGAGKTTLFNVLTGELPINAGRIHLLENSRTNCDARILCLEGLDISPPPLSILNYWLNLTNQLHLG